MCTPSLFMFVKEGRNRLEKAIRIKVLVGRGLMGLQRAEESDWVWSNRHGSGTGNVAFILRDYEFLIESVLTNRTKSGAGLINSTVLLPDIGAGGGAEGMVTVGIISCRKLVRQAFCSFLSNLTMEGGIVIPFDVDTFADACERLSTSKPQLLLIDCGGMAECLSYLQRIRELSPATKCLLLTQNADEEFEERAVRNGAWGLISQRDDPELLGQAFESVLKGEMWFSRETLGKAIQVLVRRRHPKESVLDRLTVREGEVAALLARGLHNREIAETLFLSEHTIRKYTETIYRKLGVNSRIEAVLVYYKRAESFMNHAAK